MSTCNFCGRDFANTQSVRAHLKGCDVYRTRSRGRKVRALPKGRRNQMPKAMPKAKPRAQWGSPEPDLAVEDRATDLKRSRGRMSPLDEVLDQIVKFREWVELYQRARRG